MATTTTIEGAAMPDGTATTLECPACGAGTTLVAVDRNGVEIDACPRCRGIWLDRGELDKLIQLESEAVDSDDFLSEMSGGRRGHGQADGEHGSKAKKGKRGSFLGDFLDFG